MDTPSTLEGVSEPALPPRALAPAGPRVDRSVRWSRLSSIVPLVVIVAAAAFAFRYPLFFGYRWIGNSDRWNQYLLFVQFHADSLAAGTFRAWSDNLVDGFDILAQPFSFFSPQYVIPPLLHTSDVVAVFAWVSFAIFIITFASTYWVIQRLTHDRLASLTGAFIYVCSTYSLLKLSQNDTTYLSVMVAPIMFYLVHTASRQHRVRTIAVLSAIIAYCVYTAFLQEFSYVVLFLGLYALWRAVGGNRESLIAFAVSMAAGVIIAVPRLLAQFQTLSDTPRISAGVVFDGGVVTLLRFFSRDIFGRSYAEDLTGPSVNLYEGDLLFATVFASLLLVAILIDRGRRAGTPWRNPRRWDIWFLVAYVIFVLATMHVEFVYRIVSLAYANAPFQHSRIGASALMPVALLSALYLRRRQNARLSPAVWGTMAVALALVVVATTFDYEAWRDPLLSAVGLSPEAFITCPACGNYLEVRQFLAVDVIRFSVLALLFVVIATSWRWLRWFPADGVRITLALAIMFQAMWGASVWFGGPDTRNYAAPYDGNNLVLAPPGDFTNPSPGEVQQLKAALDNDNYRSITICPADVIRVDCSNPMGLFWNLRLLDGYLSAVPLRLTSLPWVPDNPMQNLPGNVTLHQIRFQSVTEVPWRLMSLLNVKDALVVSPDLYTNSGSRLPEKLQVVQNPSQYVYPRAYFAQTVEPVSEAEDIADMRSFFGACTGCDNLLSARKPIDEVEGPVAGVFDDSGDIAVTEGADRLDVTFPPSAQQRFLVLNELYNKGWTASTGDQELAVYPTNLVMRGVLVPAGASQVTFVYHSFLPFAGWYTLILVLLGAAVYVLYRRGQQPRASLPGS
jgi:hypothetical protein